MTETGDDVGAEEGASEDERDNEEEELSDDDYAPIPLEEERHMTYGECYRAFRDRQTEWDPEDILSLVWMIRMCMAPVFGFVNGFCRIPTLVGQIFFVWLCTKVPSIIILKRTGVDPFALVDNPAKFMRSGTVLVYLIFIVCSLGGRILSNTVFSYWRVSPPSQEDL